VFTDQLCVQCNNNCKHPLTPREVLILGGLTSCVLARMEEMTSQKEDLPESDTHDFKGITKLPADSYTLIQNNASLLFISNSLSLSLSLSLYYLYLSLSLNCLDWALVLVVTLLTSSWSTCQRDQNKVGLVWYISASYLKILITESA
jgi:hypothetical protein